MIGEKISVGDEVCFLPWLNLSSRPMTVVKISEDKRLALCAWKDSSDDRGEFLDSIEVAFDVLTKVKVQQMRFRQPPEGLYKRGHVVGSAVNPSHKPRFVEAVTDHNEIYLVKDPDSDWEQDEKEYFFPKDVFYIAMLK